MAGLNDSPECLAKRLAKLERKVKTLEERLDALPTMEDMKRVFITKEDARRFATKADFKTLEAGISETNDNIDKLRCEVMGTLKKLVPAED